MRERVRQLEGDPLGEQEHVAARVSPTSFQPQLAVPSPRRLLEDADVALAMRRVAAADVDQIADDRTGGPASPRSRAAHAVWRTAITSRMPVHHALHHGHRLAVHVDHTVAGHDVLDVLVGRVGHQHPRPGREAARPDADLHARRRPRRPARRPLRRWRCCRRSPRRRSRLLISPHHVEHALAWPCARVDHEHVDARVDQRARPARARRADADGGADAQPPRSSWVACGNSVCFGMSLTVIRPFSRPSGQDAVSHGAIGVRWGRIHEVNTVNRMPTERQFSPCNAR